MVFGLFSPSLWAGTATFGRDYSRLYRLSRSKAACLRFLNAIITPVTLSSVRLRRLFFSK